MFNELERLRTARIEWQSFAKNAELFSVLFENTTVFLRLNEFPHESLCTVIFNDRQIDLEVFPSTWSIAS
jgi:hypothetical protein